MTPRRYPSEATTLPEIRVARPSRADGACRSPIEAQLRDALLDTGWIRVGGGMQRKVGEAFVRASVNASYILSGLSYRLDFAITLYDDESESWDLIADIETDGHDFHERTKEQAKADRSRDRAMTKHGVSVVRFTGAEVYADAIGCAEEVNDIVAAEVQRRTTRSALLDEHRDARAFRVAQELRVLIVDAHQEVSMLSDGLPGHWPMGDGEKPWYTRHAEAEEILRQAVRKAGRLVGP